MNSRFRLLDLLVKHSFFHSDEEPFVLSSGKTSFDYVECGLTTRLPLAQAALGYEMMNKVPVTIQGVGGPSMGADPIAAAMAAWSINIKDNPIPWFSIRRQRKEYGVIGNSKQLIEGPVFSNMKVVVVEDVITTGDSILESVKTCISSDLDVISIVVLVDGSTSEDMLKFLTTLHKLVGPQIHVRCIFTMREIAYEWKRRRATK